MNKIMKIKVTGQSGTGKGVIFREIVDYLEKIGYKCGVVNENTDCCGLSFSVGDKNGI